MVDPEFTRVLLRVVSVGLILGGVATGALVVAFRAFGSDKPRDLRAVIWIAGMLIFVIIGCMLLLRLSVSRN